MRRLLVAGIVVASVGAFIQIAAAADMTVKVARHAPPPPLPVYSWTGFYIGGNVGYSWGNADTDFNADPVTVNTNQLVSATIPGFVGSESVKPKGIIGGGQLGYNWQFSPNWVAGLEADIQASGEKASNAFSSAFNFVVPNTALLVKGTADTNYEAKILWFGTVRGRIGYAWDRLMLYATGGFAYGEVKLDGTRTVSGTISGNAVVPFSLAKAIGHTQVNTGWTVGAGVEGALAGNWTWKVEYLYVDLGSLDDADAPTLAIKSVHGGQTFTHTTYTDNVVRVGANYRF
jgi:outer membrane immunogenic protein